LKRGARGRFRKSRNRDGKEVSHEIQRLIWANLTRKKIRLLLTLGSFAVALLLFAFSGGREGFVPPRTDIAGADRLIIINRTSIIKSAAAFPIATKSREYPE